MTAILRREFVTLLRSWTAMAVELGLALAFALLILALGVFLSFSRAAWGLFLLGIVILIFCMLLKERSGAFRLRILILSLAAIMLLVASLVVALQFPKVNALF